MSNVWLETRWFSINADSLKFIVLSILFFFNILLNVKIRYPYFSFIIMSNSIETYELIHNKDVRCLSTWLNLIINKLHRRLWIQISYRKNTIAASCVLSPSSLPLPLSNPEVFFHASTGYGKRWHSQEYSAGCLEGWAKRGGNKCPLCQ